jgi:cell division protein FtsB
MKKKKRAKKENIFLNSILLLITFLSIFTLIRLNLQVFQKRRDLETQKELLEKERQELESQKQELENQTKITQNQGFLEKIARENFNLKKEGEKVIAFAGLENIANPLPKENNNNENNRNQNEDIFSRVKKFLEKFLFYK